MSPPHSRHPSSGQPEARGCPRSQAGMSLLEVLVAMALMAIIAGSLSTLVGAAIRSKLIVAVRSSDTETARQALEWMSERLRNAGLNVNPGDAGQSGYPLRCKDMVVAQDAALQPTASSVYVSGEILNTTVTSGDEIMTIGYYLGADPETGIQVIMEYRNPCAGGSLSFTPLTDPRITVTQLAFTYFTDGGVQVTNLTDVNEIRRIRMIRVALTVQGSQGTSGVQAQSWTRDVMLRNPEPNANSWKNPTEPSF